MTWTKRLTSAVLACVLCTAALTTGALAEDAGVGGYDATHRPSHSADYVLTESATYDMKQGTKEEYTKYGTMQRAISSRRLIMTATASRPDGKLMPTTAAISWHRSADTTAAA